jgi:hypothetical protein|tara:strand:- start:44 stop:523 length:480 start_codon:yes stop_codon:yes gene_type:complete
MRKKIIEYFSKKIFKPQKTTGTEVVNPFKANPQTKESAHKIELAKIPGQVQKKFMPVMRDLQKASVASKQSLQKLRDEKITASGVSKGKDMKAKGGRVGLSKGSGFPDYSGDGKITMKDVLMGRGVIPKKKGKKKMMAKKTETPMQKAVKKNKNKKRII